MTLYLNERVHVGAVDGAQVSAGLTGHVSRDGTGVVDDCRAPAIEVMTGSAGVVLAGEKAAVLAALIEAAGKIAQRMWEQRRPMSPPTP